MLALDLYRKDLCQQCGFPTVLHDPRYHFAVEFENCPIRAALDRFNRMQSAVDEEARKHIGDNHSAALPSDGRQVTTRMKPPRTSA